VYLFVTVTADGFRGTSCSSSWFSAALVNPGACVVLRSQQQQQHGISLCTGGHLQCANSTEIATW